MFGVGLGFLMRSAERRGLPFERVYRNRMIGLLFLGVAHGFLFFPGDILTIYAVTGSILYLFRDLSVRRLVRVGVAVLVLQALIAPPLLLAAPETPPDIVAMERAILTEGGFFEAVLFRSIGFAFIMPSFLVIQGISALGWFCLGLAAMKSGMIDDAAHPLWQRAQRWCLGPGVLLSLAGAAIWQWGPPIPGVVLSVVAAPVATLGYLGLIAALSRPRDNPRPWVGDGDAETFGVGHKPSLGRIGAPQVVARRGLQFRDYNLAVQAAIADHGVLLGSAPILKDLVSPILLVRALPQGLRTDIGYDVVAAPGALETQEVKAFIAWITAEAFSSAARCPRLDLA